MTIRNSLVISLLEILLSGGSCAIDSIFDAMSLHDKKLKTLEGQQSTESSACYGTAWPRQENKNYRRVRQRQWGKWVAEIRLPQNRARVWLGTFDSPKAAPFAYDIVACMLRGESPPSEFHRLPSDKLGFGKSRRPFCRCTSSRRHKPPLVSPLPFHFSPPFSPFADVAFVHVSYCHCVTDVSPMRGLERKNFVKRWARTHKIQTSS